MFALRTALSRSSRIATIPRNTLKLFLRCNSSSATTKNLLNKAELPFTYSTSGPTQIKYSKDHEWIALHPDGVAFMGITTYAANALGDVTYIELPETGRSVKAGDTIGSVESVKSASEVYIPVDATVVEVNTALEGSPQLVNSDPMGKGWMVKLQVNEADNMENLNDLLSLDQYEESLKNDDE